MNRLTKSSVAALLVAVGAVLASPSFAHDGKLTFAPVLEKVTPAVVNIDVAGSRRASHPFFRGRGSIVPVRGSGAGVIVDAEEGHIVTNHHVINDADEITVTLQDRRQFKAEVMGSDPATDIALLKVEADDLQALSLGDSDKLAVGDFVVAIGNPFELGHTVTSGIVSALGRGPGFSNDGYEDFIQTDAAINRGNSGGALVDLDGHLVGINSAIITPSGASAGLGFAVPSNIVKVIAGQILEYGEVRRGQLGVIIANLAPEDADALDLESVGGVLVTEVVDGTAAEEAGIEPGDVIVSVDDEEVVDVQDLRTRMALAKIGNEVELGVIRDGERRSIDATIGAARDYSRRSRALPLLTGAEWRNLSPEHELYGEVQGVEITAVATNSPAWQAGLRGGDVILRVNRQPVSDVDELVEALDEMEVAGLLVQRGNRRLFALIR